MAGVVPRRATSGRKQWNVHEENLEVTFFSEGHRCSLKRLRSQMATDGCPESQVVLAKQLLDEPGEVDSQRKENERLGVYWLIKASEQGNLEATDLLKTCLQIGKGITELNYLDVKSCITMTQHEKLARRAAREMFASLSNGGEYITSNQLQRKILEIDRDRDEPLRANGDINRELVYEESESDEDTDWSQKSDSNEKLTEDSLVAAAVDYSHGQLPEVNNALCLSDPDLRALDHIPYMQRSILHPLLALKILYFKLIRFLGRQFFLLFPLAKSEMQLLALAVVYMVLSSDSVIHFLPMFLYYVSFIVMVVITFQTLHLKREFHDFRLWSGLFICYSGGDLDAEQAEFQYICNNLKPYGIFFVSLAVNLVVYPVVVDRWIPQSELMILSFCLTFATLLGFMHKKRGRTILDFGVLLSFGINVLAKYPYETDPVVAQGWRFLDLNIPTFASYVVGNGIEFCINFQLLLYLCIPFLLVKIASSNNWKGTYQFLIPHCITLSWLQICIISSQGATTFGLLRGGLALVGIVLFLPLMGLTTILLPAAALTKWIVTSDFIFSTATFTFISGLGLGLCWILAQTRYKKLVALIQSLSLIFAILLLFKSAYPREDLYYKEKRMPEVLSFDVYQRSCHLPIWQEENVAIAQIKCSQLQDANIHWDGNINEIRVKSISNLLESTFDHFPSVLKQYFYCLFGDEIQNDCTNLPPAGREDCLSFHNSIKSNRCSLQKYNSYIFEIVVRMQSGIWAKSHEVIIVADNYFKNFTLALRPNDHIWFKGTLFNNAIPGEESVLGGYKTYVNLDEVGCFACSTNKLSSIKKEIQSAFNYQGLKNIVILITKFVLNVILNPVVVFK